MPGFETFLDVMKQAEQDRKWASEGRTVPAEHFLKTLEVNINNERLSDAEFREFVRTTLGIVKY